MVLTLLPVSLASSSVVIVELSLRKNLIYSFNTYSNTIWGINWGISLITVIFNTTKIAWPFENNPNKQPISTILWL